MLSEFLVRVLPTSTTQRITEWRTRRILSGHPECRQLVTPSFHFPMLSDEEHVALALRWFDWATDMSADGGVPQSISIRDYATDQGIRIAPSYPETSGYILCTLIYGLRSGLPTLARSKLDRLCDYLIASQSPAGGIPGPGEEERLLAFDTGQALTGLTAYFRHVEPKPEVKQAIEQAADWMSAHISPDGSYRPEVCYNGQRAYYVQATIGLLHAAQCLGRDDWLSAAGRNADWAHHQHVGNGWFRTFSFEDTTPQNLHGIAYTIRGMVELGHRLNKPDLVHTAQLAMNEIADRQYPKLPSPDSIPGHYAGSFDNYRRTISPTGMAQIAICALMLGKITGDESYTRYGYRLIDTTKGFQLRDFAEPGLNGLLPGSWPITGPYMHASLPNWPVKFFLDALYMKVGADPLGIEG